MDFGNYKTMKISQPIFLKGGEIGILLVHGYTGSPHDFAYMANELNKAGFTVSVPRLPGHGTCGEDFLKTNAKDWLRRAYDAYYDLNGTCKEVYICGLSMGGIIALVMAAQLKPKKLATLAAATHVYDNRIKLTPLLALFRRRIPRENNDKYDDPELEHLKKEYWIYNWPKQAAELYKLMKLARKTVSQITSDTLIIAARNDNTVPLKAAEFIYHNIASEKRKMLIFERSGHVLSNDIEKEAVTEAVKKWFLGQEI
ncbi:MAG: alpha/beta fold hydrolase [Fervidobacterium sp.]|nr:alpha/beta fold hydrolase [Fervidobacterium sp.]